MDPSSFFEVRIFPLRKNLLDLSGVLDHDSHSSKVLTSTSGILCRGKNGIESFSGCRALCSPDLLPGESGFLKEQDIIGLMRSPLQAGRAPSRDVGRDTGPSSSLVLLLIFLGGHLGFPYPHPFLLIMVAFPLRPGTAPDGPAFDQSLALLEPIVIGRTMLPLVSHPVIIPVLQDLVRGSFQASGETGNRENQKKRLPEHAPLPPVPDLDLGT